MYTLALPFALIYLYLLLEDVANSSFQKMPTEFVSKTFVRDEVARAASQTRAELVVEMERMLGKLKAAHVDNESGITEVPDLDLG
jgi:hypothetical protein